MAKTKVGLSSRKTPCKLITHCMLSKTKKVTNKLPNNLPTQKSIIKQAVVTNHNHHQGNSCYIYSSKISNLWKKAAITRSLKNKSPSTSNPIRYHLRRVNCTKAIWESLIQGLQADLVKLNWQRITMIVAMRCLSNRIRRISLASLWSRLSKASEMTSEMTPHPQWKTSALMPTNHRQKHCITTEMEVWICVKRPTKKIVKLILQLRITQMEPTQCWIWTIRQHPCLKEKLLKTETSFTTRLTLRT